MDVLEKWMIIRFTSHQTITLPKWMVSQKHLLKSSLLLNGYCGIQICPQGPNQQRGHLPSLLSLSFFNGSNQRIYIGDRRDTVPGTAPPCVFQTFAADRAGGRLGDAGGCCPFYHWV